MKIKVCRSINYDQNTTTNFEKEQVNIAKNWKRTIVFEKIIIIVLCISLLLLITAITILIIKYENKECISHNNIYSEGNDILNNLTTIIGNDNNCTALKSRSIWLAQPPVDHLQYLNLPVEYIIIMHTATSNCFSVADCISKIRAIQKFHMNDRHWSDIGYNFLIGGEGSAYEGRGWKHQGAHTFGYNSKSIGIALMGQFNKVMPSMAQLKSSHCLIEEGVHMGFIDKNYKLIGAKQVVATQSPGTKLLQEIKTWPHWLESP